MTDNEKFDLILAGMQDIKQEVSTIKEDLAMVKEDLAMVKEDLAMVKEDLAMVKEDLAMVKEDLTSVKLHIENITDRNISILAENHLSLINKLNDSVQVSDRNLIYEVQVNYLTDKVKRLEKEVEEIKCKTA